MIWTALLREYRAKLICLGLALVTVVWWNSTYVVTGRANYKQLQENAKEYERVKEILNEKEEKEEELRDKLYTYCTSTRNPQTCRAVSDSGVTVEEAIQFKGLAKFAVVLARSEQNYNCPPNSFNCYGLGAYDRYHYNRYESYLDATLGLARLLKRFGYSQVSPKDFLKISHFYKGVPPYLPWVNNLKVWWEEIG